MSLKVEIAPLSTPIDAQKMQLWLESAGRLMNSQTSIKNKLGSEASIKIHYVNTGAITFINYTGNGNTTIELPIKCKYKALINVSNGNIIAIDAGTKQLVIPAYESSVTLQGFYFNDV